MQVTYFRVWFDTRSYQEFICDINDAVRYARNATGRKLPNLYNSILRQGIVTIHLPNNPRGDYIQISRLDCIAD